MSSFSLLITSAPFDQQDAFSAFRFAESVIAREHEITGIFFYQAGVNTANSFQTMFSDELSLYTSWCELADKHDVPLLVCISAANRRGNITQQDALEVDIEHFNLRAPFQAVGLGDLIQLMHASDRLIQF